MATDKYTIGCKKFAFVILASLFAFLGIGELKATWVKNSESTFASKIGKSEYLKSIERAQKYLSEKNVIHEIGSLFLKKRLSPEAVDESDIPAGDAFARLFGERFIPKDLNITRTVNSNAEIDLILEANEMSLKNYFYKLPERYQNTLVDPWDDVLIKALYCDVTGFDDIDSRILANLRDHRGGYLDTHNLLGLLFLEGNQCSHQGKLLRAKEDVVEDIVAALETDDVFSDLYAERVACLFWAGAGARVKPAWIEIIRKAQRADGGWAGFDVSQSSAHPTGLAALSIKYLLSGKNKADFYQKQ